MSFFHSNTYKKTLLPLIFAIVAFIFTVVISELEFVRNFEYQITDTAKFRLKNHIEAKKEEQEETNITGKVDSEIMILGVNEASFTRYVDSQFGTFPWPREVYAEFLAYFNLDLPRRFKSKRIISILAKEPDESKRQAIGELIYTAYEKSDTLLELVRTSYPDEKARKIALKVYEQLQETLGVDYGELTLKKELLENTLVAKQAREKIAKQWFNLVYKINLDELKALTWNSIRPQMVFFDIFIDLPRDKKSDKLLFDELKRQRDFNYIFIDFLTSNEKDGRFLIEGSKIKERMDYLKKMAITNIHNNKGKKITPSKTGRMGLDIKPPLLGVLENVSGVGPANILVDKDGKRRKMPLIWKIYDERLMDHPFYIPTIDLTLTLNRYYNIKKPDDYTKIMKDNVKVELGKAITLKKATIRKRLYYVRSGLGISQANQDRDPEEPLTTKAPEDDSDETLTEQEEKDESSDSGDLKSKESKSKDDSNTKEKSKPGQAEEDIEKVQKDIKYRWTEFVDPFMDLIIKRILNQLKQSKTGDDKLNYTSLLKVLLEDSQLKMELEKKYKENSLNLRVNQDVLKKEIIDFLNSLTETSLRNHSNFFMVEDKRFHKVKLTQLKKLYERLNKEYLILPHLIQEIEDKENKEKKIVFLNNLDGNLVYKGVTIVKEDLISENQSSKTEINSILELLKKNQLIRYKEELVQLYSLKILNEAKLNQFIEKQGDQKVKDTISQIGFGGNVANQKINELYSELKGQFKVNKTLANKILKNLQQKNLISFNKRKAHYIQLEISKLYTLQEFRNNSNLLNAQKVRIIDSLIKQAEISSDQGNAEKYFSLPMDQTLNFIKEKSDYPLEIIKTTLKKINAKYQVQKGVDLTTRIILDEKGKVFKIAKPKRILIYTGGLQAPVLFLEKMIGYLEGKDSLSKTPYYHTLLEIGKNIQNEVSSDLPLSVQELEILLGIIKSKIVMPQLDEPQKANTNQVPPFTLIPIPEKDKIVKVNPEILKTYLIQEKDIIIPIDIDGQININFQGENGSYINTIFGKYMMYSRGLPHPAPGVNKTDFDWQLFKNKVVCIGFNTSAGVGSGKDHFGTPYGELYGIEIHANALYTLLERDFIYDLPGELFQVSGLKLLPDKTYDSTIFTLLLIPGIIGLLVGVFYYLFMNKIILSAVKAGVIGLVVVFFLPILLDVINNGFTMSYVSTINLSLAVVLGLILPRISILRGFLSFFIILLVFIASNIFYIFPGLNLDIPLMGGILTIGFTFIGLTIYKLVTEEKEKRKIKGMFSKYVSPDLVHQLLNSSKKLELGGEDKILTVLFSDIRGFTKLSEGLDPQALVSHLNEYYTAMTQILQEYKGTLDKYIGDAIMAFWGAPIPIADHALLACKTCLEMMEKLDEMNDNWPVEKHIHIGIGLNSGNMTVGNMGSANRMDYTIMGDNVNLGSRVESVNKMYTTEVIITEYTYELVKDMVICRELDMIRVKGKEKPVKIYELLGINE